MKEVRVAQSAGFCFGVQRAVQMVYDALEEGRGPIYTYGPIIHNEEVVRDMQQRGVGIIRNLEELDQLPKGTVILRSHGVTRAEEEAVKNAGFRALDAACPFVKKIHRQVEKYSSLGYRILITGSANHPEVQGICGWACPGSRVDVISSPEELEKLGLKPGEKTLLVSQTTFNLSKFKELVEIVNKKGYDILVLNTICDATEKRQTEAQKLAAVSDAMIVIGDRRSSNTQKLFEISKKECENTYYIQTSSELDYNKLQSVNHVGITAGASTPKNIIEEVSKNVRNEL